MKLDSQFKYFNQKGNLKMCAKGGLFSLVLDKQQQINEW